MSTGVKQAAIALVVVQVVHGFIPAETEAEGYVGAVGGLILLVASLAAVFGAFTGRAWATPLTGWTGLVVAVGFTLYHAVPVHGPLTNPYFGEPVGVPAWIGVAAAVVVGIYAAAVGLPRRSPAVGLSVR